MRFLRKYWLIAALGAYVIYTVVRFGIVAIQWPGVYPTDFGVSMQAAVRLAAGEAVYRAEEWSPFKYSPAFLLVFRHTFGLLPVNPAWAVWVFVSISAFCGALALLLGLLPGQVDATLCRRRPSGLTPQSWHHPAWQQQVYQGATHRRAWLRVGLLVFVAFLFGFHGYLEHFSYGQADYLVLSAFIAAACLDATRPWLSAFLMAGAMATKPPAALLVSYFIVTRDFRQIGRIAVATVAVFLSPALFWGPTKLLFFFEQWRRGLSGQTAEFMTGNLNQSLAAVLARLSGHRELVGRLSMGIGLACAALVGAVALRCPELRRPSAALKARLVCAALLFYCLVTPLSWRWLTFVWTPCVLVLGWDALASKTGRALSALFVLTGLLLQTAIAHLVGVREVDNLSYFGLYCFGSALLFALACLGVASHSACRR